MTVVKDRIMFSEIKNIKVYFCSTTFQFHISPILFYNYNCMN